MKKFFEKFRSSSARYGAASTTITALVLVGVVLVNVIASMAGERMNLKIDLTANSAYQIGEETKAYLETVDKEIDIIILDTKENFTAQNQYFTQADTVINQYALANSKIQVSYVDLVEQPGFEAQYPDYQLESDDIIVQCGDRVKILDPLDLFNTSQYYYTWTIESSKAEEVMTSTIMALTSEEEIFVSILTGHGESGTNGIADLLETNNLTVVNQSLVTEDIRTDAKLAIIAAPTRDYDQDMLTKLDNYLAAGGTLLYLADPSQPSLPNLENYLTQHGITVGSGVVFETNQTRIFNYNAYFPVVSYAESVYSAGLSEQNLLTAMPYCRPLELTQSQDGSYTLTTLLQFAASCGVYPADADENWQPTQDDLGIQVAMAISTLSDGGRIVVSGSLSFADPTLLTSTSVSNSTYLMNLVNEITEREESFSVEPKELGGSTLSITAAETNLVGLVFVVALPVVLVLAGIFVWLGRKNR